MHSSVLILLKKKQKWWSHTKKHAIYGPDLRFVSVLHENGTVLPWVPEAFHTRLPASVKSYVSACGRRNEAPSRTREKTSTHTGPSSSRSHVITPNYIRLKIPKTIPCSAAHNPFASGWHINTNKWRQREYRYWGSIGFKLHCHSYSILYPLLHTVIAMIYLRSYYSPFSHRP